MRNQMIIFSVELVVVTGPKPIQKRLPPRLVLDGIVIHQRVVDVELDVMNFEIDFLRDSKKPPKPGRKSSKQQANNQANGERQVRQCWGTFAFSKQQRD